MLKITGGEERRMKIFFENNFQPLKIGFLGRVYKK